MNLRRLGWAAAIGRNYKTRDGRVVRLMHYGVTMMPDALKPEADIVGHLEGVPIEFNEQGHYRNGSYPEGGHEEYHGYIRQPHPLDLVEAVEH